MLMVAKAATGPHPTCRRTMFYCTHFRREPHRFINITRLLFHVVNFLLAFPFPHIFCRVYISEQLLIKGNMAFGGVLLGNLGITMIYLQ